MQQPVEVKFYEESENGHEKRECKQISIGEISNADIEL